MGKQLVFAVLWVATAGIAFFLGTQMVGELSRATSGARHDGAAPEYRVEDAGAGSAPTSSSGVSDASAPERPGATTVVRAPDPYVEEKFSLEEIETVGDLSDALMAYALRKLNQGPEGHKELFRTICALLENKDLRNLVRDERQLQPLAYPWLRFGMDHERQIVDMMETLYRTAAKDPAWFEGLDDDPFELFTEGLAVMLPSLVDAERLARFRGYAETVLKADETTQPKALRGSRRDLERNLEMWSTPLTQEQVLEILRDPSESDEDKLALLRTVPARYLDGVDVAGIIAREFQRGNLQAYRTLRGIKFSAGDLVTLDRGFIDGMVESDSSWMYVGTYLRLTGRREWAQCKPIVEEGLRRGGKVTERIAQGLPFLPERPPVEYVQSVIASYALPEATVAQLKARYGIKD